MSLKGYVCTRIQVTLLVLFPSKEKYNEYISVVRKQNKSNIGRKKRPNNCFDLYKMNCLYTKHQVHIGRFLLTTDGMDYFTTLFVHIYVFILKQMVPDPRTFETDAKFSLFILHSLDPSHGGWKSKYLYTRDMVTIIGREGYMSFFGGGGGVQFAAQRMWDFRRSSHKPV